MQHSTTSTIEEISKLLDSSKISLLEGRGALLLHLADNALILAQRNSEWCGHGPVLEQDIALTNISLDLLGQARNFYQYAALLINQSDAGDAATENTLAYLRPEREFKNLLITELPIGDWAQTILRQFFFSIYQDILYGQLQKSKDVQLAAIAQKSLPEVRYHVKWSSEWVIRLGDGTQESKGRMLKAIDNLLPYTGEFFTPADYEGEKITGFDLVDLKQQWLNKTVAVLNEATLGAAVPENENIGGVFMQTGGKQGIHTENLGFILAEMQYLQRMHPGAEW